MHKIQQGNKTKECKIKLNSSLNNNTLKDNQDNNSPSNSSNNQDNNSPSNSSNNQDSNFKIQDKKDRECKKIRLNSSLNNNTLNNNKDNNTPSNNSNNKDNNLIIQDNKDSEYKEIRLNSSHNNNNHKYSYYNNTPSNLINNIWYILNNRWDSNKWDILSNKWDIHNNNGHLTHKQIKKLLKVRLNRFSTTMIEMEMVNYKEMKYTTPFVNYFYF